MRTSTQDIFLNRTLRFTVVSIISALGLACLILCYQGLLQVMWGNLIDAAARIAWGFGTGIAALILIKYRGDVIDT